MAPNHGGDTLGSILRSMGSHWGQKMGQNRKKLPCPKIRLFNYSAVIVLGKKSNLRLWHQITVGTPRVNLGANGVPLGPKNGSKPSNITMPQNSNFLLLRGHGFGHKSNLWLWRQITVGTPWGPSWGKWGPIGAKKWVKKVKNYHIPKFDFLTTPRLSIWAKNRIYGYGAKSRWGPPRVHLGANGVPLGPKNGSKP